MAISGAGPSILALIDKDNVDFQAKAMQKLQGGGLADFRVEIYGCDNQGATVDFE